MGYFLDSCPGMNKCCYCVPLRVSAFIIAALGLGIASCFVMAFAPVGVEFFHKYGLPIEYSSVNRYMNGAFGVVLIAIHVLLVVAAVRENDVLLEVYIWAMITVWIVIAFFAVTVILAMCLDYNYQSAILYLIVLYVPLLAWIYSIVIVGAYRLALP